LCSILKIIYKNKVLSEPQNNTLKEKAWSHVSKEVGVEGERWENVALSETSAYTVKPGLYPRKTSDSRAGLEY